MPGPEPGPLVLRSPAKINLFLNVVGKRPDGYHLLETAFQFLDFADRIRYETNAHGRIIRRDDHSYSLPDEDLVIQAANLLSREYGIRSGVTITLSKVIPPGSGMGGGSSNAATTLIALNRIWGLGLSRRSLIPLARKIGADVPLFIHGRSCWATGIGDRFEDFSPRPHWYCLCIPPASVSTAEVFSHLELKRNPPALTRADFHDGKRFNLLEPVTRSLYPPVDEAFGMLNRYGQARMNGSGSSLFVQCASREEAIGIRDALPETLACRVIRSLNDIIGY
ncbi:MAG: 4-(cytidine 5'-diphospho)-2-C-methyl-D-erythritol kinase [Gammaproteobacteria bacterium]|nr:4-(cytidine 5'-diphospho)-2-C-methyl-D-erythritol kinase [Gammaproteobacteria bacterium]